MRLPARSVIARSVSVRSPWSNRRSTRSGGNEAVGSVTVVRTLNVRGLMPSIPIPAMIAATVFSFTVSPRSRSSVVTRGDPYVPSESACTSRIFTARSARRCCRGVNLIALCHSREQAEQVKARLAEWLASRGLVFNEDKTQITHLDRGVDFLGFAIRRYPNGKLLTKPSKDALRRIRKRLSTEAKALRGSNADAVIAKLNPIIVGWAAYYRIGVSKKAFNALDAHVWRLVYKWARFTHANKPTRWVTSRYFGKFNPARQDSWVFGSQETGFYLRKFAWTVIVRHRMVAGTASLDDPSLADYWATRRRRSTPPVGKTMLRLLKTQQGRCSICRGLLLHADREPQSPQEWEQWLAATRKAIRKHAIVVWGGGGPDERIADRLIHAYCQRRVIGNGNGHSTSGCL